MLDVARLWWTAVRVSAVVSGVVAATVPATADGRCLKSERPVQVGKQAEKLREYLCRGQSSAPSVKVAFYRLSEALAGGLAMAGDAALVEPILGRARLVETAPLKELRALMKTFGESEEHSVASLALGLEVPGGKPPVRNEDGDDPGRNRIDANTDKAQKITSFLTPWADGDLSFNFPLPHYVKAVQRTTTFPPEFAQTYTHRCEQPAGKAIECMFLWKYLTRREVERYEEFWRLENRQVGQPGETSGPFPGHARYWKLMQHIARDGWPEDWLPIETYEMAHILGGCGNFAFIVKPRRAILDVAVLENVSSLPIKVDQLLGFEVADSKLRPIKTRQPGLSPGALPSSVGEIASGARVVVPLRMAWVTSHRIADAAERAKINDLFRKIQALPEGTSFKLGDNKKTIRKSKASLKPPTWPSSQAYAYGPEVQLDGLMVAGERLVLEGTSANFVELTVANDGGSCPFLSSYNPVSGLWRNYGKVIHTANGRARETTQAIEVDPMALRFRLTEQELERAKIDRISLEVTLRSGQRLVLLPALEALREADGSYHAIYAGETLEIVFTLPDGVSSADIARSQMAVRGYYERYGTFEVSVR